MIIGREKEKEILQNALTEEYSQFVAVYGRRRDSLRYCTIWSGARFNLRLYLMTFLYYDRLKSISCLKKEWFCDSRNGA